MIALARQRVEAGLAMSGLIVTSNHQSIGHSITQILLIADSMSAEQVAARGEIYLPLTP